MALWTTRFTIPADDRGARRAAQGMTNGWHGMEYEFTTGAPITEEEALAQVAAMGLHGLAFDDVHDEDETLHWHEFEGSLG